MAKRKRKTAKKKGPLWWRVIKGLIKFGIVMMLLGCLAVVGVFWYYGQDLPDINTIDDYNPKQVTRVYSADGELIELWVDEELMYRWLMPFEDIPEHMRMAVLAAEDADFYNHPGFDFFGFLRAAYENVRRGSFSQGASTITQQVVKNLILSPERTIRRKVQEVLLAFRLEDRLTKDEILAIYLNEIYLGGNRYGVEEAAQYYFGISVSDVNLAQAATLAGLIQSPARYNPYRHPEEALRRREYVLNQMWQNAFIEESAYRSALEAPLELAHDRHPHLRRVRQFTNRVRQELFDTLGREAVLTGGLQVYTTLRLDHQYAAEEALRETLREFDERHDAFEVVRHLDSEDEIARFRRDFDEIGLSRAERYEAVVVSVDDETSRAEVALGPHLVALPLIPASRIFPDGQSPSEVFSRGDVLRVVVGRDISDEALADSPESVDLALAPSAEAAFISIDPQTRQVLAMVGGYDQRTSVFNRATQAHRQTGSAFKPFIYGTALNQGLVTPASLVRDEPTPFRLPGGRQWNPQNSDGEYLGQITLRRALAQSRNVVSVRLLQEVGLTATVAFAEQAGFHTELTDNLTTALGSTEMAPIELVNAYATLASGGLVADPITITRVENSLGEEVWVNEYEPVQGMDPALAFLITDLMTSVVQDGTARDARELNRPTAGKTGTTNQARDAWFVGFVPQLVGGAWVGYDDYRPLGRREYGGRAALPIWLRYMQNVLEGEPVLDFQAPETGLVQRRIDPDTGLLARSDDDDAILEWFLDGSEPTRYAPEVQGPTPEQILLGVDGGAIQDREAPSQQSNYDDF